MQSNEMECQLSPSTLDTPLLATPNILTDSTPFKSSYISAHTNPIASSEESLPSDSSNSITAPSTVDESGSSINFTDEKVLKIEDALKKDLLSPRKPTPSPFEKLAASNTLIHKPTFPSANDTGLPSEVPTTADVVLALESLTNQPVGKFLTKSGNNDNNDRESNMNITDNTRCDSSQAPSAGFTPSPKKIFLLRSKSITDSSQTNHHNHLNNSDLSQSQKGSLESDTQNTQLIHESDMSMDDTFNQQFTRNLQDASTISQLNDGHGIILEQLKAVIGNGNDQVFHPQLRTETDNNRSIIGKQQMPSLVTLPNKRGFSQTVTGVSTAMGNKPNSVNIPHTIANEVTSSDQTTSVKRQKTVANPSNHSLTNIRTASSSAATTAPATTTHNSNTSHSPDDPRKKQIRDSNREAARRCRERRRQYIEELEKSLEQSKAQIKQLNDKITRLERENIQLRAMISETKLAHPSSRLSSNESIVEYVNVVSGAGINHNSDSNLHLDGATIQRGYISRDNL